MRLTGKWLIWSANLALAACTSGGDNGGGDDGPGTCAVTLDSEQLASLTHSFALTPVVGARPGQTLDIDLGTTECCYSFQKRDVCASFSVSPEGAATIDAVTGELTIDPSTPSGTKVHVVANVQDGARTVELDVHVYTPEAMPEVGIWTEDKALSCDDGSEVDPAEPIGEVAFWPDGTYSVTWFPFEIYRDYWGPAAFDRTGGTVDLQIAGGNMEPANFDGAGELEIVDANTLRLRDMWLGTNTGAFVGCGHVLRRSYGRPF